MLPPGPTRSLLPLCYHFANTCATTRVRKVFPSSLLSLCYHLCYHPRSTRPLLPPCYYFATTLLPLVLPPRSTRSMLPPCDHYATTLLPPVLPPRFTRSFLDLCHHIATTLLPLVLPPRVHRVPATTLLPFCYHLAATLLPPRFYKVLAPSLLPLCSYNATVRATTKVHKAPCYHLAATLLPLCYHLVLPPRPTRPLLPLCYHYDTTLLPTCYHLCYYQGLPSLSEFLAISALLLVLPPKVHKALANTLLQLCYHFATTCATTEIHKVCCHLATTCATTRANYLCGSVYELYVYRLCMAIRKASILIGSLPSLPLLRKVRSDGHGHLPFLLIWKRVEDETPPPQPSGREGRVAMAIPCPLLRKVR